MGKRLQRWDNLPLLCCAYPTTPVEELVSPAASPVRRAARVLMPVATVCQVFEIVLPPGPAEAVTHCSDDGEQGRHRGGHDQPDR
jgi:hypothetical protein